MLIYKTFAKKEEKTVSFKIYFLARYLPAGQHVILNPPFSNFPSQCTYTAHVDLPQL